MDEEHPCQQPRKRLAALARRESAMTFWVGVFVGFMAGGFFGVLGMALCVMAADRDRRAPRP
jgi:hypothetical protein